MRTRIVRGSARDTAISWAHSSGTRSKPRPRAAVAGKAALRSGVTVKMQLTTAPVSRSLRAMSSCMSSSVAPRMSLASLRSAVVAPRRAKRRIGAASSHPARGAPQGVDLVGPQTPRGARRQGAQRERPEGDAPQPGHGVPDGLAHPAHLALAALAQDELEIRTPPAAEPPDAGGRGAPVLEVDAFAQPRERAIADGAAPDPRPVGLGDLEAWMGQAVGE